MPVAEDLLHRHLEALGIVAGAVTAYWLLGP
jgi:hypothetical protein